VSEPIKYGETRVVNWRELEERPGLPSQIMREVEADVIGRLARSVALSGRRFDGWPEVKLVHERDPLYLRDSVRIVAEVVAK
jgi:hypothetical protein